MRQPEHCAGSSGCTLPLGQECSQLLEAWYFPALMRETSTHSMTKQEKRCGISRRGARSRQTGSPSPWTDSSGLPSAPIACCMFSDSEQSRNGQACGYAAELLQTSLNPSQVDAESSAEVVAFKPITGES